MERVAALTRFASSCPLLLVLVAWRIKQPSISAPTAPLPATPAAQPETPSFPARTIALDQRIADRFIGNDLVYAVTTPADGTLVVSLNWDPAEGDPSTTPEDGGGLPPEGDDARRRFGAR